jgi:DNA-3-methyladenine glycosylase
MTVLRADFYARPVLEVARDLIGCTVRHGDTAGVVVETEAYHEEEPACHAFIGLTARTRILFGGPGNAYVYRSYGIHALLNAVCEREGIGAAVLIRALSPSDGLEKMRRRRGGAQRALSDRDLCSGPGRLTQALGIELEVNGSTLMGTGPVSIESPHGSVPEIVAGPRIGITKAVELPWRFCAVGNPNVSKPWPWRASGAGRTASFSSPG